MSLGGGEEVQLGVKLYLRFPGIFSLLGTLAVSTALIGCSSGPASDSATGSATGSAPEHTAEAEHAAPEEAEAPHVYLPTMRVSTSMTTRSLDIPGRVAALPDHSVRVSPQVAGKVISVYVVPGQKVAKGQVIAALDSRQLQAQLQLARAPQQVAFNQVAQAKINLDLAQKNLDRLKSLYEKDIAAQKDVVAAQSQLDLSKAQVEAAQARVAEVRLAPVDVETQLTYMKVQAPISGVIAERFVNVGSSVDPSTPIVHIVNLDEVIISAEMPADSDAQPRVNQPAMTSAAAMPGMRFPGRVISISPVVNTQNNTSAVEVLCANSGKRLKEGQQVTVSIAVGGHSAVTVPRTALVADDDPAEHLVYVVVAGKLEKRKVKTGASDKDGVAILDGLHAGEEIVTSGAYGIADGAILERRPLQSSAKKKGTTE